MGHFKVTVQLFWEIFGIEMALFDLFTYHFNHVVTVNQRKLQY